VILCGEPYNRGMQGGRITIGKNGAVLTKADVLWVGLSAKPEMEDAKSALAAETFSGELVALVEQELPSALFHRTNFVDFAPLSAGRLRYPSAAEMEACWPNRELEIRTLCPKLIILLGHLAGKAFAKATRTPPQDFPSDFAYKPFYVEELDVFAACVHHPSYIKIYKRKFLPVYCENLKRLVENSLV